jgi:hypothetical protein
MIYFLFLVTLLLGFLDLAWLLLRFLSSTASRYLYKDELNNCTLSLDLQYVCFGFLHAGPVGVERYRDVVVALLRAWCRSKCERRGRQYHSWVASRGKGGLLIY